MPGRPTNLDYSRARACCASLQQVQDRWTVTLFCMCHPSFHIYIQIISFSFVHQSRVHYLFPIHLKYLIFFCLSISCPLSLSITFKLSHFLLFINLISNVSGTPFHLNHLIMIVSGTSIPFLSHSLSFINLMPTYSIQILILFCSSVSCPLSLSIEIILFSFVHQSLVHLFHSNLLLKLPLEHPFHSYLILLCSSISCTLSLVPLTLFNGIRNRSSPEVSMLVFQTYGH